MAAPHVASVPTGSGGPSAVAASAPGTTATSTAGAPAASVAATGASVSWSHHVLERVAAGKHALRESLKAGLQDIKSWRTSTKPVAPAAKNGSRVRRIQTGVASVTYRSNADDSRLHSSRGARPLSSVRHDGEHSVTIDGDASELGKRGIFDADDLELDVLEGQEDLPTGEIVEEEDAVYALALAIEMERGRCASSKEFDIIVHDESCECDVTIASAAAVTAAAAANEGASTPEASVAHNDSVSYSHVKFHSCTASVFTPVPLSITHTTCHITGFITASASPELDDGRWHDDAPYETGLVPRAPHMTCSCILPWRSMAHLWDHHVQPTTHQRNIVFEGANYPDWRGQFYSNGEPKAVLRGLSHEFTFFAAIIYGCILFSYVTSTPGWIAAAIQIASQLLLYGVSSQFHRRIWSLSTYNNLKRLDHCAIFLLAAGTATPSGILMVQDNWNIGTVSTAGWVLLAWAWGGALTGVIYSCTKPLSGRVSIVGLVLMGVVGACMVPWAYQCYLIMKTFEFALLVIAWLLYLLAICTYSRKWLDLWPSVFGYHEMFHLITIAGGITVATFNFSICVRVT